VEAFFERRGAEIDEQSDGEVHQTEIGQDLFAVDWRELFHRLEFHDFIEKKRVLTRRARRCFRVSSLKQK
jgi:hypothetical protein